MITKVFPKQFNREAFYLDLGNTKYRVYKIEYFFSSVGCAWVLDFFISYSDLNRFKKSKCSGKGDGRFSWPDITEKEIEEVLKTLRKTGVYNIERLINFFRI